MTTGTATKAGEGFTALDRFTRKLDLATWGLDLLPRRMLRTGSAFGAGGMSFTPLTQQTSCSSSQLLSLTSSTPSIQVSVTHHTQM